MIVVVIVVLLMTRVILYFVEPVSKRSKNKNNCIANLKQLDSAKQQWAAEKMKLPTDIPAESDIFGGTLYLRAKLICYLGGTYSLNAVSVAPTCSKSGAPDFHTL